MEPLGSERHGWESQRPSERERVSHSLHRLVRLFVIHGFDRRDCCLDGHWIKRE